MAGSGNGALVLSSRQAIGAPMELAEIIEYAKIFAASGYFTDAREMAQAATKIIVGQELGLKPAESVNGIHMIQNKPSTGANLQAKLVKLSARYDYVVLELTNALCRIQFYQDGEPFPIESVFTADDARKAQTKGMDKFPRNMLFARAMTNGIRFFCPDVTAAAPYTPEELGADVDEQGDPVPIRASRIPAVAVPLQPQQAISSAPAEPVKPLTSKECREYFEAKANALGFEGDYMRLGSILLTYVPAKWTGKLLMEAAGKSDEEWAAAIETLQPAEVTAREDQSFGMDTNPDEDDTSDPFADTPETAPTADTPLAVPSAFSTDLVATGKGTK